MALEEVVKLDFDQNSGHCLKFNLVGLIAHFFVCLTVSITVIT